MKYTIEDFKQGIVAVQNDGTLEQWKTFYMNVGVFFGKWQFYYFNDKTKSYIGQDTLDEIYKNYKEIPTQSVKDFLSDVDGWKPKFGDIVWVRNADCWEWEKNVFVSEIEYNGKVKYLTLPYIENSGSFFKGVPKTVRCWSMIRKYKEEKQVEYTMDEIADRLGIPVTSLKIKK